MNGTVLIELTHEQHYRLLEVLRISKGALYNEDERRILDARRCLSLPEGSKWRYHDWTPEDEQKERKEEEDRNRSFYEMVKTQ